MKIKEYTVIQNTDANELQHTVARMLKQGWQPLGGVAVDTSEVKGAVFLQTMVQYDEDDSEALFAMAKRIEGAIEDVRSAIEALPLSIK